MGQFVRQREHLRRLGVGAVDEHERRDGRRPVRTRGTPAGSSLRRLLLPTTPLTITRTPSPSACSMNRRSASVQVGIWRRSSRSKPSAVRMLAAVFTTSLSSFAEPTNGRGSSPSDAREFAIPLLALLAEVDGVEQVRARSFEADARQSAEVRYGYALNGRFREEEVTDRCVGRLGEALQLLQGRPRRATAPSPGASESAG